MKIKILLFYCLWALLGLGVKAQMISPYVLPTQGAYLQQGNAVLSLTVGEPIIPTFAFGNQWLTQGFQQPEFPCIPTVPLPQVACSDTQYTFAFNATGGVNTNKIEWATNRTFSSPHYISSPGSIILSISPGATDTIWLKAIDTISGFSSPAVFTTASVDTVHGYINIPDTVCIGDSFNIQYGGGYYYKNIEGGFASPPFAENYNNTATLFNDFDTGTYYFELVVSLDSTFSCTDTVYQQFISFNCCHALLTISDTAFCTTDSVCISLIGATSFSLYIDSIVRENRLDSGAMPFSRCAPIGIDATPGYHLLIAIVAGEDSSCNDTLRKIIYINPYCACGNSDSCPLMTANFTYEIFPGYVWLHDISTGDPTFIEWYIGGQSYITQSGDTMDYSFSHSGNLTICLTVHHLIYGSDICCVHDTCIAVYGVLDTCDVLDLSANFSYNASLPHTLHFYPALSPITPSVIIWNFGDSTGNIYTDSASTITHTYDSSGTYYVCMNEIWLLPGNYCCIDSQCYSVYVGSGEESVHVIPNPAKQTVTFKFEVAQASVVDLSLIDNVGQVITVLIKGTYYKQGFYEQSLDVSEFSAGAYTYLYKVANKVITGKFIKL